MPTSPLSVVIQHLLADLRPDEDGMTDGELLARFQRSRDEDALASLVRRHASMVWGVSRRLLNHHDAEDAFQATFLVLVRKAAGVPRQAVANWLYGVARQTAVRQRATAAKRRRRETQVVNMPEPTTPEVRDTDLQRMVDEELSRLPDHYRGVVVLCDLEGMTRKEAARQLGIPEGSVASRLARARAILAKRLAQRGIVISGSVAAVLSAGPASASAPPALVASTIKAASLLAAGQTAGVVSSTVADLTEGVVKAMFVTEIKSVLAVVLVVGLALAGTAGLLYQTQAAEQSKGGGVPFVAKTDQKEEKRRPTTKEEPAPNDAKPEQKVLTPEEAIKQMPKETVTVQFKVAKVEMMFNPATGFGGPTHYIYLHDGGKFTARLAKAADQFMAEEFKRLAEEFKRLGIKPDAVLSEQKMIEANNAPAKHFGGKVVRVTGRVEAGSGSSLQMWVRDLADIELVEEKPSEKHKTQAAEQPKGAGGPLYQTQAAEQPKGKGGDCPLPRETRTSRRGDP
jgi:RNA polymerase sigma factor (sigma-70 family)